MRRAQTRPRPIDVYRKLPIDRSADLGSQEPAEEKKVERPRDAGQQAQAQAQPELQRQELGAQEETRGKDGTDQGPDAAASRQRRKTNIPIPVAGIVQDYEHNITGGFEPPVSYIRVGKKAVVKDKDSLDYVLEKADVEWLDSRGRIQGLLDEDRLELMIDLLEKASGTGPAISQDEAERVLTEKLKMQATSASREVVADVYQHWVQKRLRTRKPLLRAFWPTTAMDDTNPHMVFRPREKERYKLRKHRKNDMESFRKMQQLRRDFDRLRDLFELVHHREKMKRLALRMGKELFEQQLHELQHPRGPKRTLALTLDEVQGQLALPRELAGLDEKRPTKRTRRDRKERRRDGAVQGLEDDLESETEDPKSVLDPRPRSGSRLSRGLVPSFMEPYGARLTNLVRNPVLPQMRVVGGGPEDDEEPSLVHQHWVQPGGTDDDNEGPSLPGIRFTCRGRIGRGGRVIFDRLPCRAASAVCQAPLVIGLGRPPPKSTASESPLLNVTNEPLKVEKSRLDTIYSMSDSEDEELKKTSASHTSAAHHATSSNTKFELFV